VKRPDFDSAIQAFCTEHGLGVFMILTFTLDPEPRRQILVYHVPHHTAEYRRVNAILAGAERLQARRIESGTEHATAYEQGNVKASRKQVLPCVFQGFQGSHL